MAGGPFGTCTATLEKDLSHEALRSLPPAGSPRPNCAGDLIDPADGGWDEAWQGQGNDRAEGQNAEGVASGGRQGGASRRDEETKERGGDERHTAEGGERGESEHGRAGSGVPVLRWVAMDAGGARAGEPARCARAAGAGLEKFEKGHGGGRVDTVGLVCHGIQMAMSAFYLRIEKEYGSGAGGADKCPP